MHYGRLIQWIVDRVRASIIGAFGVIGENDNNGRGVVEFCAEMGLCVGNTDFDTEVL